MLKTKECLPDLVVDKERFWAKVRKTPSCWLWTAAVHGEGYGIFWIRLQGNRRSDRAHRVSWMISHRRLIPKGKIIRHTCDNRLCVRPSHLKLGSYQDNSIDSQQRGRNTAGERSWFSRLTNAKVKSIRKAYGEGMSMVALARTYGVARTTIRRVVLRETWKHI